MVGGAFSKRHPNFTLRAPSCLPKSRAVPSDASAIHQYFEVLNETLETLWHKGLSKFNIQHG